MRLSDFGEGERQILATRLGLSEDASDEDLQSRLAAWMTEEPSSGGGSGDGDGGGDGGEGSSTEAGASVDDLNDDEVVVVDVASYRRLQQRDRMAAQIEAANRERDRDELIAEAVHDGKISPSRADHYKARFDSDPEGTVKLLNRLTKNTIPLEERGVDAAAEEADTSEYPREWIPEVAAQQGGQPRNRIHKD